MKQTILTLSAILAFSVSFGQSKKEKYLDSLMKSANRIGIFNGNIIIAEKGEIIYRNELGFTDFTKNKKLTQESKMPIGSITKELNSTGILFLAEKEN